MRRTRDRRRSWTASRENGRTCCAAPWRGTASPVIQPRRTTAPPPRSRRGRSRSFRSQPLVSRPCFRCRSVHGGVPNTGAPHEHGATLVVQEDPERVDAERGAERQHEQVEHGQPRGRPSGRAADWRRSACPAQTFTPPPARSATANTTNAPAVTPAAIRSSAVERPIATAPTASSSIDTPRSRPMAPHTSCRMPSR